MRDLTESYPKICDALRAHIAEHFIGPCDQYGCQDESAICEISAQSYDGFIAFTNGGFRTLVHNSLRDVECEKMSDFETSCLQGYIDSAHEDAADDFVRDNPELNELFESSDEDSRGEWLHTRFYNAETEHDIRAAAYPVDLLCDKPPPFYTTDASADREEFYEFESEYMSEGGTFFYELTVIFYERDHRRNVTGEDEIFIFAGINTDFEYGRERGLRTIFEQTYKLDRLTPDRLRVIIETCANRIIH